MLAHAPLPGFSSGDDRQGRWSPCDRLWREVAPRLAGRRGEAQWRDAMADQILFDKLGFIDRLKRGGVIEDHARAHAEAMEAALRESVATKSDIVRLEARIELAVRDMTRRMWTIAIALFAALVLIKFFG